MRKLVAMTLVVSVPGNMSARHARREVRTLINDQCNYSADDIDVKVRKLAPAKMPLSLAAQLRGVRRMRTAFNIKFPRAGR